jgi:hypothetical protein
MRDPDRHQQGGPSLGEVVGNVLGTVAEIGWSLLAAGKGVLALASRLVRLAQEQWRPSEPAGGEGPGTAGGDDGGLAGVRSSARGEGLAGLAASERRGEGGGAHGGASPKPRPRATSAVAFDAEPLPPAFDSAPPLPEGRREATEGPVAAGLEPEATPLPERYGVDRLGVLARDPDTVFVWWEVSDERCKAATRELEAAEAAGAQCADEAAVPHGNGVVPAPQAPVYALHVAAAGTSERRGGGAEPSWMVPLLPLASSRYVEVPRTSQHYEVTLGLTRDGRFVPLVGPRHVETPASEVSRDETVRWRTVGVSGATVEGEAVGPETQALWDELRRRPLPASADWWPPHRLADLELGSSHGAPRA